MPYVANTPAFTFNNSNSKPILIITKDGDVEWHGKPSEAASIMVSSFQFAVEEQKGVTKAARRRYYYRACKNILNKAEKMEHKEFVDFLQKQVYNKERTIILDGLKGN
jgi:accessory colonization factor AcfC